MGYDVIGDIHGHARALDALLEIVRPEADDTLVTLGDVIDRGPDSRGVLDTLIELGSICQVIPILGNHEEMMLAAIKSSVDLRSWVEFGGAETLESYGRGGRVDRARPVVVDRPDEDVADRHRHEQRQDGDGASVTHFTCTNRRLNSVRYQPARSRDALNRR